MNHRLILDGESGFDPATSHASTYFDDSRQAWVREVPGTRTPGGYFHVVFVATGEMVR